MHFMLIIYVQNLSSYDWKIKFGVKYIYKKNFYMEIWETLLTCLFNFYIFSSMLE